MLINQNPSFHPNGRVLFSRNDKNVKTFHPHLQKFYIFRFYFTGQNVYAANKNFVRHPDSIFNFFMLHKQIGL